MEPVIEYVFGVGDGSTTTWNSSADLTLGGGAPDAIRLDFDGDGRRDDVMWDSDGDGRADCSGLDLDDDGTAEQWFSDNGSGVWGSAEPGPVPTGSAVPAPAPTDVHLAWTSLDGEARTSDAIADTDGSVALIDLTGEGTTADRLYDRDADGRGEIVVVRSGGRVYFDTDGDQRFDQVLVDHDLDGTADAAMVPGDPGFTM